MRVTAANVPEPAAICLPRRAGKPTHGEAGQRAVTGPVTPRDDPAVALRTPRAVTGVAFYRLEPRAVNGLHDPDMLGHGASVEHEIAHLRRAVPRPAALARL